MAHATTTPTLDEADIRLSPEAAGKAPLAFGVGAVCLAGAVLLGFAKGDGLLYFWHAYLTNWLFFATISLGALFFVMLQFLVGAMWSVAVRRVAEFLTLNLLP